MLAHSATHQEKSSKRAKAKAVTNPMYMGMRQTYGMLYLWKGGQGGGKEVREVGGEGTTRSPNLEEHFQKHVSSQVCHGSDGTRTPLLLLYKDNGWAPL